MDYIFVAGFVLSFLSSNYFEYYFRDKSSLLRKNRNSIAVLSGYESENELKLLSDDIFIYFGLGCRNISKIFVPTGYDISQLKNKFDKYSYIINHNKYSNNYNYQKTIKIMNNDVFVDCDFFLMSQSKEINPPISIIYYDYYDDISQVSNFINEKRNQIQCIVTNLQIDNSTGFGDAQDPKLDQYADNTDTINFLLTSS